MSAGEKTGVVVVGASVAGCATAVLLARQGVRVTVLEKSSDPEHHKRMCTHFIVSGARPVLARLGIEERMREAGAMPNEAHVWSRWGWAASAPGAPHGWNLRRSKLDPMLRELAQAQPGIDLRTGLTVTGVIRDAGGRVAGIRGRARGGDPVEVHAQVVIAADGRYSDVAALAGVPGRILPHRRIGYFGYFADLDVAVPGDSFLWFREPDTNYVFPNDDGLSVLACFVGTDRIAEFRADPYTALVRSFDGLDRGPGIEQARLVGKVMGKLDMPNVRRPAARPGLAFVGDAAQASDPLWGVGVGFAFISAQLLADELGPALAAGGDVDAALVRYHRRHRSTLLGHHLMTSDYASGRAMNAVERLLFSTAPHHAPTAAMMAQLAGRERPLQHILTPPRLMRTVTAAARHRISRAPGRTHAVPA